MAEYQNYDEIPTEEEHDRKKLLSLEEAEDRGHILNNIRTAADRRRELGLDRPAQLQYAESGGFVSKYTEMNPEFEDMMFDGSGLENGMIVLANSDMRRDVSEPLLPADFHHARKFNRWCEVSNLVKNASGISFLATYEDGTKHRIDLSLNHAWIYKIPHRGVGVAQVPGQMSVYEENDVEAELRRLRKEDFGE